MLMIRLRRMGSSTRPVYRVEDSDRKQTPTAAVIEEVGFYNPRSTPTDFRIDRERVEYWGSRGAQMSPTVRSLFDQAKS